VRHGSRASVHLIDEFLSTSKPNQAWRFLIKAKRYSFPEPCGRFFLPAGVLVERRPGLRRAQKVKVG
jgi:hypothetical protein